MGALIARRLLALIPILLVVTFGVFMLVSLVPGDVAITLAGGETATPERIAEVREELHLDEPIVAQYARWLGGAVQLDFGDSLVRGTPVAEDIKDRFPVTFGVMISAAFVAILIGLPLGLFAGLRPGGRIDGSSRVISSLGYAIPSFWLASILVVIFAVRLKLLPPSGFVRFTESPSEWARYMVLPAITLGFHTAAAIARQLRASMVDVLDSNYVRTAWAVGGGAGRVLGKHGLKNAAIPAVTVFGLQIGYLLGGTVIVEQIFSIPGLGSYLLAAITAGDLPAIQGVVIVLVLCQVGVSIVVDITYGLLNPKVRVAA